MLWTSLILGSHVDFLTTYTGRSSKLNCDFAFSCVPVCLMHYSLTLFHVSSCLPNTVTCFLDIFFACHVVSFTLPNRFGYQDVFIVKVLFLISVATPSPALSTTVYFGGCVCTGLINRTDQFIVTLW